MQIAKWGNTLVVPIPTSVVEALDLKEGDDIAVRIAEGPSFEIERNDTRRRALERIASFGLKLPEDWTFDRDDANVR